MAEPITIATICSGLIAAAGAVADWGVSEPVKQRIREWLEKRYYRFRYTNLRTFGRDEAQFSLAIIEKFLGKHLLSPLRIQATLLIYLQGVLWGCAMDDSLARSDARDYFGFVDVISVATGVFVLWAGISITISSARLVLRFPWASPILSTFVLVAFHTALFLYWSPVVLYVHDQIISLGNTLGWPIVSSSDVEVAASILASPGQDEHKLALQIQDSYARRALAQAGAIKNIDQAMALLLFGFRMGLMGFFALGVLYVKAMRPTLIWFWRGLFSAPVLFTPPASAIAALIFVGTNWREIAHVFMPIIGWIPH